MTTIVVDTKVGVMAADRRVTGNEHEVIMSCPTKIEEYTVDGETYLVGCAGLEGPCQIFLDWFASGDWDDPPEPLETDEVSILVLSRKGCWVVDEWMRMVPVYDRYHGIGSGGGFAWAVLEAGCGIEKALTTAIRMDPFSGGEPEYRYL